MILRFKLLSLAGATAFLSTPSDAFVPARTSSSRTVTPARQSSLRPDWDNEDFLSSRGGSKEQQEEANAKYQEMAENRKKIDAWRLEKAIKENPDLLKKMGLPEGVIPTPDGFGPAEPVAAEPVAVEAAATDEKKNGPSSEFYKKMGLEGPPPAGQQVQPPPQMSAPPSQQAGAPQQQVFDASGNPVSMPMVYDANGNLVPFNPAATQQPPPIVPSAPAIIDTIPLPQNSKSPDDPRPVGFNADSFTMANTADVYFAQLKQDAKTRKAARMSGDLETANTVFGDDTVRQIGDSWVANPYTMEKNRAEAAAEIEGAVRMQMSGNDNPEITSGVSYKEMLQQKKAKRAGGGSMGQQQAVPPPVAAAAAAVSAPPKVEQPVAAEEPKVVTPAETKVIAPPAAVAPAPALTGPADGDEVRGKLRTLQGLLLKHRGGSGFGAGRLKAPEAKRLEDTLEDVKGILRSEVGGESKPAATVAQPVAAAPAAPVAAAISTPPPPPVKPAAPVVPAPAQAATMVSAATSQHLPDPIAGSVACVEAALNMYKASQPAERELMMIPLREALKAATNAMDKFISERDNGLAAAVGMAATAQPPQQPAMGFPTEYAVTKPDEDVTEATTAASTKNVDPVANKQALEDVYNSLTEASGAGGKLGLKNMSGDEANALADKIQTMRGVLLDELHSQD